MKFVIPDNAEGVQMHGDGRRYDTKPGGTIEVDSPAHLQAIKASEWYKDGFLAPVLNRSAEHGPACDCGLSLWPWQSTCSRCARSGG